MGKDPRKTPFVAFEGQQIFYQDTFEGETDEGDVVKVVSGIEPGEGGVGILWNIDAVAETRSDLVRRLVKVFALIDKVSDDRPELDAEDIRFVFLKYFSTVVSVINDEWDNFPWR